jgi:flagellar hook-length control protein FliK
MIIQSIIPGALAPTENDLNVETPAGDLFESLDFSNLLASLVATVPQTVGSTESTADITADSAESVADNHQVPQESDETVLDPSTIFEFMAPITPTVATIAALEPPTAAAGDTAAIVATPCTEAVNVDADHAVNGDAVDQQPVQAARFSLPLERSLPAAALEQDLDSKNDRISFANKAGRPQDGNDAALGAKAPLSDVAAGVGIAVPIDTAILEQSESTQSGELSPRIVEPRLSQDRMKPADVLDSVASTNDSPAAAPKELRSSSGEGAVEPAQRQTLDSKNIALKSTAIEEKAPQVRPIAVSQSSFANQHEESSADHSQFKPRALTVDPQDGPLQRSVPMPADAAAAARLIEENVANENTTIELEPPELGKIKIELRVEGEQIHARIVAEEPGTKALIESRLGELRQALEVRQVDLANLQVEQQNVSSGGARWGQTLNDGSRQGRGQWQDDSGFADRSANDAPQGEGSQSPASDPGRISMWARSLN